MHGRPNYSEPNVRAARPHSGDSCEAWRKYAKSLEETIDWQRKHIDSLTDIVDQATPNADRPGRKP